MQQIFQNGRRRRRRKAIPKTASEALLAVKKHSVTRNCSDLSLFEKIVPVISKNLLTVGQNNFGNKIPTIFSNFELF